MRWPMITLFFFLMALGQPGTAPASTLRALQPLGDNRYALLGELGERCGDCEVIIEYADGLRYAAPVEHWKPSRLVVRIPDLNRSLEVSVRVLSAGALSEVLTTTLTRALVPRTEPQTPTPSESAQFVEYTSDLAVGDKGMDLVDLSAPPPGCGSSALLFDHARIVYTDRRFGEAQIVAAPPAGCVKCTPLSIRWYHEPTGRLSFQLHIYKRIVEGVCPERVR